MLKYDRKHYNDLKSHCKKQGLKIREVGKSRLLDYAAMNPRAAKVMHFKNIKKNEILIDKNLSLNRKVRDLRHELIEMDKMTKGKDKGKYWPAHNYATINEVRKTKWEK